MKLVKKIINHRLILSINQLIISGEDADKLFSMVNSEIIDTTRIFSVLIFRLKKVTIIDYSFAKMLVETYKICFQNNVKVELVDVSPKMQKKLENFNLKIFFDLNKTLNQVIEETQKHKKISPE